MNNSEYPETATDALEKWDAGDPVWTIEMGGIGPGYEQCIQITAFEIIRALKDEAAFLSAAKGETLNSRLDAAIRGSEITKKLGLSGAQAGAAKNLAYNAITRGWRTTIESVESDRRILASNSMVIRA